MFDKLSIRHFSIAVRKLFILFAVIVVMLFLMVSCSGSEDNDDDDDSRSDDTGDDDDDLVPPGSTTSTTTTTSTVPSSTTTTSTSSSTVTTTTALPSTTTTSTTSSTVTTTSTSTTYTTTTTRTTTTTSTSTTHTTTTTRTTTTTSTTWPPLDCYRDEDLDSYGVTDETQTFDIGYCPLGWSDRDGDFNDAERTAWTDAPELPDDGIDQDGDGFDLEMSDATGVFVAKEGDDANPGTMAEPKLTVQAGVDLAASDGKSVFVAQGTYEESVVSSVSLFGGYEYPGWTRDIEVNVSEIFPIKGTALEFAVTSVAAVEGFSLQGQNPLTGDPDGSIALIIDEDTVATVVRNDINGGKDHESYTPKRDFGILIDGEALVMACTVYAGEITHSNDMQATGIRVNGRAVLSDNEIDGGTTEWGTNYGVYAAGTGLTMVGNNVYGGDSAYYNASSTGVYASGNFVVNMMDNNIDGGYAQDGASSSGSDYTIGLRIYAAAVLVDNVINGGQASGAVIPDSSVSGAVDLTAYAPSFIVNNVISGGSSSSSSGYDYAGAFGLVTAGTVTILHNTIYAGSASGDISKTVSLKVGGPSVIVNNILDGGYSGYSEDTTYVFESASPSVIFIANDLYSYGPGMANCLIYGGTACVTLLSEVNDCAWYGCVSASGNIEGDPSLADEARHLESGSQCIDAGADPSSYDPYDYADFDFEGDARPQGSAFDIGADEWVP